MLNVGTRLSDPRFAIGFVLIVTLWRVATLPFDETDLWVDEAQYWLWGQHLDWGYFSKPPLIAFWLRAITDLAGSDSAFWIRVSGAFFHAATAGLIALSAARLFDRSIGALAAILYVSLPMVTLGSWLFTTDTLLLPCFAFAFYAYLRLTEAPSLGWAIALGVGLGLGFLAKYAVIYFPLSLLLATVFLPSARIAWRDAGIAFATMAVVISPNIWWNITNGGTTLRHVANDNVDVGAAGLNPAGAVEFLLSQLAVFGPVFFLALIAAVLLVRRFHAPRNMAVLLVFALPVILLMTAQGLRAEANANWAVVGYVTGTIAVAALLANRTWLVVLGLGLNLILVLALPMAYMAGDTLRLPNGRLLADRYQGMAEMSDKIIEVARAEDLDTVVATRRNVLADLFHRFRDAPLNIHAPDPAGPPHNYYEQLFSLPTETEGDVLFVHAGLAPCPEARLVHTLTPVDGHLRGQTYTFWRTPAACLKP